MEEPDAMPGEKELLRALEDLSQGGRRILAAAREESAGEKVQEFVSQKIGCLAELIRLYANFFNSLHVQKRSDTEDLFKRFYHSVSVQDQVEDLLEFEAEWNNFLGDVDGRMKAHSFQAQLAMGTQVPGGLVFTDVRTEREVQLGEFLQDEKKLLLVLLRHFAWLPWRDHLAELQARQSCLDAVPLKVVLIAFGCRDGAVQWLQETKCPYDMLLDPSRQLYHAFGLGVSIQKVWNIDVITYYAEQIVSNRLLPKKTHPDDVHQLGGDFGLNQQGTIIFFHPSASPTDRPGVAEILKAMK